MTGNTSTFENACRTLYRSYGIMNRICWQGKLPECRLALSGRMSPHTAACARNAGPGDLRIGVGQYRALSVDDKDKLVSARIGVSGNQLRQKIQPDIGRCNAQKTPVLHQRDKDGGTGIARAD